MIALANGNSAATLRDVDVRLSFVVDQHSGSER